MLPTVDASSSGDEPRERNRPGRSVGIAIQASLACYSAPMLSRSAMASCIGALLGCSFPEYRFHEPAPDTGANPCLGDAHAFCDNFDDTPATAWDGQEQVNGNLRLQDLAFRSAPNGLRATVSTVASGIKAAAVRSKFFTGAAATVRYTFDLQYADCFDVSTADGQLNLAVLGFGRGRSIFYVSFGVSKGGFALAERSCIPSSPDAGTDASTDAVADAKVDAGSTDCPPGSGIVVPPLLSGSWTHVTIEVSWLPSPTARLYYDDRMVGERPLVFSAGAPRDQSFINLGPIGQGAVDRCNLHYDNVTVDLVP
jgi:hypothetical protein